MSLKTTWTAPGMGVTVGELRKLLGREVDLLPEDSAIKTDLNLNDPYISKLEGYDRERAEMAIGRAIYNDLRKRGVPCPESE